MRAVVVVGICAVVAAVVVGFTTLGGSNGKRARPELRIVSSSPVILRGEHFRAREQVRVKAESRTVRTRAGSSGYFVVRIPGTTRCDLVRVVAVGSGGSYAVLKTLASPMCMPARSG